MKDVEIIKARNVLSSRARTNLAKRLRVAAYCRVSTDSEDQLNSYKSQVQHYTDLIKSKSEWDLAGIYADEAITGTQVCIQVCRKVRQCSVYTRRALCATASFIR